MSSEKKRHFILCGNRLIIYIASLIGLFFDINIAYVIALTLWVWLPQFVSLELNLLRVRK